MICKKGALKNFTKFTGKHLCQSLFFDKAAETGDWHRCFRMNFANFFKKTFFIDYLRVLLLYFHRRIQNHFHRRIQNPVEHLIWSILQKQLKAKGRSLFLQNAPSQIFDTIFNTPVMLDRFYMLLASFVLISSMLNPFQSNVTFLYPLKTTENRRFSKVFRGYRNVTLD